MMKKCLINRTLLVKYNRVRLFIKIIDIPKLMSNEKKINI